MTAVPNSRCACRAPSRGHFRRDFFERALRFLVAIFFFDTFVAFAFFGATGAGSECEALVFRGALGLASWSI